jgi:hypothetical protein
VTTASPTPGFAKIGRLHGSTAGLSLVEALVALTLLVTTAVTATHSFLVTNRIAGANRVLTSARAILQRNIDNALTQRWDSTTTPSILATTSAAGSLYDDDGGADNQVALLVQVDGANTTTLLKGSLNRIVTAVNPQIRRVTFRLTYTYQRRNYSVEMTTMRAIDD